MLPQSEISFNDAIKLVHPDSNPNITDAGNKVSTVMLYKNDPIKLHRLLTNWGILKIKPVHELEREMLDSLIPNHVYDGTVWITHKKGMFKVMRTTTKRVYLDGGYSNHSKVPTFCHINSVKNAFKVKEI